MSQETKGTGTFAALVFERQERRPEQVLVRVVERHPSFELSPAATYDEQAIAVYGGGPGVGMAGAGAWPMGQDKASEFSVDTHLLVSFRETRRG
jgi:hypothetical protein